MSAIVAHDGAVDPEAALPPPGPALFASMMLGIDFSAPSLAAARWAAANVAGGAVATITHVIPAPESDSGMFSRASRRRIAALSGSLHGVATALRLTSARIAVRVGRPSHELSAVAADMDAPLVVLGRRGDANRKRIGEPNVIERVARTTAGSVLVVPQGVAAPVHHILAAVDDSAFAPGVLRSARELAALHACPITVVHVLSPVAGAYDRLIRAAHQMMRGRQRHRKLERLPTIVTRPAQLSRWLVELTRRQEASDEGVEIAIGDPAREIASIAAAHRSPLIVTGKRGADGAPTGSLGSVARDLLARSPVPVLAVSGPDGA